MKTFTYTPITTGKLSAVDLITEVAQGGGDTYRITIYNEDGRSAAEHAEALHADGRLGIAWGADSTWADVSDVESGIEMWLNDGEAWAAAN